MSRRTFVFAGSVALLLNACAPSPDRESDTLSTGGLVSDRITVVVRGTGPDIVLISGLASHRDVWAGVADTLDDRYRLHLVQVNGFAGFAPGANAQGEVAAPVAEEIARYVWEAGLVRPAVIGHSMGGTIGMMVAARQPGSVGRLMIVDMTPFMGMMFGPAAATAEGLRSVADGMRDTILAQPLESPTSMLGQMIASMTRTPAMQNILLENARASHRATVANAFHELIVTDMRPELSSIDVPVTVLYVAPPNLPMTPAQYDSLTQQSWSGVRNARLIRIEDSNHFIQLDQPSRFVAEMEAFMRR